MKNIFIALIVVCTIITSSSFSFAFGKNSKSVVEKYITAAQKKDYDTLRSLSYYGKNRLTPLKDIPKFKKESVYAEQNDLLNKLCGQVTTAIPIDSKWNITDTIDKGIVGNAPMDFVYVEVKYKNGSKVVWRASVNKKSWHVNDLDAPFYKEN